MICGGRGIRRALAVPIWVLMLAPGLASPILDRDLSIHTLAMEKPGHGPGAHALSHDHDLCTQVRANPPVPVVAAAHAPVDDVVRFALTAPPPGLLSAPPQEHPAQSRPTARVT